MTLQFLRIMDFGTFIKSERQAHQQTDRQHWTLRQLAARTGIEPSYLSKIERGLEKPPSEEMIIRLADELEVDRDVLLALAGKLSKELQSIIMARPKLFAEVLRQMKQMPDDAILNIVREPSLSKYFLTANQEGTEKINGHPISARKEKSNPRENPFQGDYG